MSKIIDAITKLVEPHCEAVGVELVDVEYAKEGDRWILRLLVDKPEGISIDDCELVSRRIDPVLDEADPIPGQYYLEVSSPGIERPLKKPADYERFAGSQIQLRLFSPFNGKRDLRGVLLGWRDNSVLLDYEGEKVTIPIAQVSKCNLVAEF